MVAASHVLCDVSTRRAAGVRRTNNDRATRCGPAMQCHEHDPFRRTLPAPDVSTARELASSWDASLSTPTTWPAARGSELVEPRDADAPATSVGTDDQRLAGFPVAGPVGTAGRTAVPSHSPRRASTALRSDHRNKADTSPATLTIRPPFSGHGFRGVVNVASLQRHSETRRPGSSHSWAFAIWRGDRLSDPHATGPANGGPVMGHPADPAVFTEYARILVPTDTRETPKRIAPRSRLSRLTPPRSNTSSTLRRSGRRSTASALAASRSTATAPSRTRKRSSRSTGTGPSSRS